MDFNIEYLHMYKRQRDMEFPGVPIIFFTDWTTHKEWMFSERKKHQRMVNNYRILLEIEEKEAAERKGS